MVVNSEGCCHTPQRFSEKVEDLKVAVSLTHYSPLVRFA